jgi:D-3-phosphoglycerate dehydrogenase / 2-oxoglutarate reductase
MKILVCGDSYCPSDAMRDAFAPLAELHEITFRDVVDEPSWRPSTPSDGRIKELLGSPRQVLDMLDGHDVIVVQGAPITEEIIAADPNLGLVCVARGGPVNVDIAAATARGIPVVTTPGKNAEAVVELTVGFMVMLARRMPEVMRYVEGGGEVSRDNYEGSKWFGHDLEGHTLGLVGYGVIGHKVARVALALGMNVLVFDPFVDAARIAAPGIAPVDFATLLGRSDFISFHARLTADNRGMMGHEQFAQLKRGAFLINTARADLIDEEAMVVALRSGRLAGAALDIVRTPDLSKPHAYGTRHRLFEAPNVIIAPHVGGATYETIANGGRMAAAEIERFVKGEPLVNVANRAALAARAAAASPVGA